jgi:hypothetical protein
MSAGGGGAAQDGRPLAGQPRRYVAPSLGQHMLGRIIASAAAQTVVLPYAIAPEGAFDDFTIAHLADIAEQQLTGPRAAAMSDD